MPAYRNPRTRRAPEGVVRCSNNNRDDLLNHDKGRGGGRIQIPGEPRVERTGTTLIGKKKRKRQRYIKIFSSLSLLLIFFFFFLIEPLTRCQ